jgi:antitoxin component YwqK of YwqJK toxin-antitoxin module
MKKGIIVVILTLLFVNCSLFAQKADEYKINQLNEKGQKCGLWIKPTTFYLYEEYYKDGVLSGLFRKINYKGQLLTLGEYCKGKRCGTWYYFIKDEHLTMIFKDFAKNTYSITHRDGTRYVPDYKCYFISYYPNGNIESEGLLLWSEGEEPESDLSREYGKWKYYDKEGHLKETKIF